MTGPNAVSMVLSVIFLAAMNSKKDMHSIESIHVLVCHKVFRIYKHLQISVDIDCPIRGYFDTVRHAARNSSSAYGRLQSFSLPIRR